MSDKYDDYLAYDAQIRAEYSDLLGEYLTGRHIEIGVGWRKCVEKLLKELRWLCGATGHRVSIGLIKEKFHGMRVQGVSYPEGTPEEFKTVVSAVIWYAEARASHICESCGGNAKFIEGRGYGGLCEEHINA